MDTIRNEINWSTEQCKRSFTRGNTSRKAADLLQNSLRLSNQSTHLRQLLKWQRLPSLRLCVHYSTSSLTGSALLISLSGSWLCTLEKSPYAVKTVTWVNLSVSQKNRLLGDITLVYLTAHWLGAVSLDPAASHFILIYHRSTQPSSRMDPPFYFQPIATRRWLSLLSVYCEIFKIFACLQFFRMHFNVEQGTKFKIKPEKKMFVETDYKTMQISC